MAFISVISNKIAKPSIYWLTLLLLKKNSNFKFLVDECTKSFSFSSTARPDVSQNNREASPGPHEQLSRWPLQAYPSGVPQERPREGREDGDHWDGHQTPQVPAGQSQWFVPRKRMINGNDELGGAMVGCLEASCPKIVIVSDVLVTVSELWVQRSIRRTIFCTLLSTILNWNKICKFLTLS